VLPQGAVADEVKATYDNGVLEVRIPCPKKTHEASTKVPVTRT
jgi:HSP20 family molecular chaperone IbpA